MTQKGAKTASAGIEPGSTAWKAAMLTIIPLTPLTKIGKISDSISN